MRPLLRPGVHILRRADGQLQLGLDPASAVVLDGSPETRRLLEGLDGSPQPDDEPVLALLAEQDLTLGEEAVLPLLGDRAGTAGRATVAALARHRGDAAPTSQRRRRQARVELVGFGPDYGAFGVDLLGAVRSVAVAMGLGVSEPPGTTSARRRRTRASPRGPVLGLLAGVGETDRAALDDWLRDGVPHVLVRMTEGRALVGPFVVPGVTACLRCVDAHYTDADRSWPLLVHQYARATGADRGPLPEPVDPALAALAAAWVARDLASYVDGVLPSTWSTTLSLDAQLRSVETRHWRRHPDCGCSGV